MVNSQNNGVPINYYKAFQKYVNCVATAHTTAKLTPAQQKKQKKTKNQRFPTNYLIPFLFYFGHVEATKQRLPLL